MRAQIERLDVDCLEWTSTNTPGIFERILNVDRETGARTLLLKSLPRHKKDLTDLRPQFHPVDEEFYCLSGNFTLEGDVWLGEHSYVYYPPRLVHGHGVDVPGGYEIYLRNSGPISTERVSTPKSDALYFADNADSALSKVTMLNAGAKIKELRNQPAMTVIPLRRASEDSDGACILIFPESWRTLVQLAGHSEFLEIFVLTGRLEVVNRACLSARNYAFLRQDAPIQLVGLDASTTLLVNYSSESALKQLEADATLAPLIGGQ